MPIDQGELPVWGTRGREFESPQPDTGTRVFSETGSPWFASGGLMASPAWSDCDGRGCRFHFAPQCVAGHVAGVMAPADAGLHRASLSTVTTPYGGVCLPPGQDVGLIPYSVKSVSVTPFNSTDNHSGSARNSTAPCCRNARPSSHPVTTAALRGSPAMYAVRHRGARRTLS